jgi:multiple sugar transport system permease protein
VALDSDQGADLTVPPAANNVPPVPTTPPVVGAGGPPRRRFWQSGIHGRQGLAGWMFITPAVALLIIFLVIPIAMAFWVSLTNWSGLGSPFKS